MKALVFTRPYKFELKDIAYPSLDPETVIIKVHAVGACGSDVHGFSGRTGRRYSGMVMGHEISGEVVELGIESSKFKIGQHVVVQPIIYCGKCDLCKEGKTSICLNKKMIGVNMGIVGGLSEYIAVPEKNIFPINENIPYELGALVEPFAVGAGAVSSAGIREGNTIAIIGSGMIGLCILLMALDEKPSQVFVIDKNKKKLQIAKSFGAVPINFMEQDPVKKIFNLTGGGVDIGIEAVGLKDSVATSVAVTRTGGKIIWIGNSEPEVVVNMQDIVVKGKQIQGVYCYNNEHYRRAITFVENNIERTALFVEEVVDMVNAEKLFTDLANGKKDFFRAIIRISS